MVAVLDNVLLSCTAQAKMPERKTYKPSLPLPHNEAVIRSVFPICGQHIPARREAASSKIAGYIATNLLSRTYMVTSKC